MKPHIVPSGKYYVLARNRRQFDTWMRDNNYPHTNVNYIWSAEDFRGCRIPASSIVVLPNWIENPAYGSAFFRSIGDVTDWDYLRAVGADFLEDRFKREEIAARQRPTAPQAG
jgi:hypothetical protein